MPFIKTAVLLSRYLMISILCPLTVCNFKNPWKQVYSLPCEHGRASAAHHPQSLLFPNYTGDSPLQGTDQCLSISSQPSLLTNQEVLTVLPWLISVLWLAYLVAFRLFEDAITSH